MSKKLDLMQRTATRLMLHDEHGLPVDTAFEPLAQGFGELVCLPECPTCGGTPCVNPSFCARSREDDRKLSRRRDNVVALNPHSRPTPQTTIEAVMYSVRTRGIAALEEPDTRARIARCDDAALKQIDERIVKLRASGRIK